MSNTTDTKILIVGAGLSGLMAATTLVADSTISPDHILIVDKGRSVGGRLATRRIGSGRADHGAQFMTVREPEFQQHVDRWLEAGVAYNWSNGWGPDFDGYPRYAIRDGFNRLGKYLAAELASRGVDIRTSVRVTKLSLTSISPAEGALGDADTSSRWQADDEDGNAYHADTVVITSPVPQSLALLDAGKIAMSPIDRAALEKLQYAPCLCGLFQVDGETTFEEPGVALNPDETVSWMADNHRKGISPEARLVTVHAGPAYSGANYEAADEDILPILRKSLQPFLAPGAKIQTEQLKRWRYAQPLELYPERFLRAEGLPPLYFGGDIFGGPRVEGASLSGITIGKDIGKAIGKAIRDSMGNAIINS